MKIKRIQNLNEIVNIDNDNVDVVVEIDNGFTFIVTIGTPQDLIEQMSQEKMNFITPGLPMIIAKKLTEKNIREVIEAYWEKNSGYWLKLYHFADSIDTYVFDQLEISQRNTHMQCEICHDIDNL